MSLKFSPFKDTRSVYGQMLLEEDTSSKSAASNGPVTMTSIK